MATVKVIPGVLNYEITRGDDFSSQITFQEGEPLAPVDVSGRTYTAQLRRSENGELVEDFSIDMTDAATGIVLLVLSDTLTADLDGSYVWDMQQESPGDVIRTVLAGEFTVNRDVTRAA